MTVAVVASANQRQERPAGRERVEGVCGRRGLLQEQGALAEVVHQEGGKDDGVPAEPDRRLTEMAEVGVQRLRTGDGEDDRAEGEEADEPVFHEKT